MFYLTNSAPELTSESATNISKTICMYNTCMQTCVYVWELLVYVSWSHTHIMYTHIGAMRMFSRVYKSTQKQPIEGEAARVVTHTYMYVQDNYSNPRTCGPRVDK